MRTLEELDAAGRAATFGPESPVTLTVEELHFLLSEVEKQRAAIEATADTLKSIRDLSLSRDDFTTGNLAVEALDELVLAGVWPMPAAS